MYQSGTLIYRYDQVPLTSDGQRYIGGLWWGFESFEPNGSFGDWGLVYEPPSYMPICWPSFTNLVLGGFGGDYYVVAPKTSNSWVIVTNQVLTTSGILSGSINAATSNKACGVEFYPSIPVAAYDWMKPGNTDVKWMIRLFAGDLPLTNSAGETIWFNLMPDGVDKLPSDGVIQ
jgi:hypothetical protein